MRGKSEEVVREILDFFSKDSDRENLTLDFFYDYLYNLNKNYLEFDIYQAFTKLFKDKILCFSDKAKKSIELTKSSRNLLELGK